jgi:prepilin-type processing-associated H-X9-DG protein
LRGTSIGGTDPNVNSAGLHGFHTRGIVLCPMATAPAVGAGQFHIGVGIQTEQWDVLGEIGSSTDAWRVFAPEPPFVGSYGYNGALFEGFRVGSLMGRTATVNTFSLREQGSIPVMLDAVLPLTSLRRADSEMGGPASNAGDGQPGRLNAFVMDRHGRQTNGMFLDWSVRRVGLKQLWTLKWASDFDRAGPWTRAGGVLPADWPEWMRQCKDY